MSIKPFNRAHIIGIKGYQGRSRIGISVDHSHGKRYTYGKKFFGIYLLISTTPDRGSPMNTIRFGMSIDERLLKRFDHLISEKGYVNRSEAIRDLIRNTLVEEQWEQGDEETFGTITLVYNHHTRELADRLIEHEHAHTKQII